MGKGKLKFKCSGCNIRRSFTARALHTHYKKHHASQCNLRCDICFNYFENMTVLTGHLLMVHSDLEPYYSDDADEDRADSPSSKK